MTYCATLHSLDKFVYNFVLAISYIGQTIYNHMGQNLSHGC